MKALKLTTDEMIAKYYNHPDYNIYFREGSDGDYELSDGHDLDTMTDATVYGFELIAVKGPAVPVIKENDVTYIEEPEDSYERE